MQLLRVRLAYCPCQVAMVVDTSTGTSKMQYTIDKRVRIVQYQYRLRFRIKYKSSARQFSAMIMH